MTTPWEPPGGQFRSCNWSFCHSVDSHISLLGFQVEKKRGCWKKGKAEGRELKGGLLFRWFPAPPLTPVSPSGHPYRGMLWGNHWLSCVFIMCPFIASDLTLPTSLLTLFPGTLYRCHCCSVYLVKFQLCPSFFWMSNSPLPSSTPFICRSRGTLLSPYLYSLHKTALYVFISRLAFPILELTLSWHRADSNLVPTCLIEFSIIV